MSQVRVSENVDVALREFIENLRDNHFFGIVEIHFHDGHLVRVKKQEVFQPNDLLLLTSK